MWINSIAAGSLAHAGAISSGLDERIGEIDVQEIAINALDNKLTELTSHLAHTPVTAVQQDAPDTVLDALVGEAA